MTCGLRATPPHAPPPPREHAGFPERLSCSSTRKRHLIGLRNRGCLSLVVLPYTCKTMVLSFHPLSLSFLGCTMGQYLPRPAPWLLKALKWVRL